MLIGNNGFYIPLEFSDTADGTCIGHAVGRYCELGVITVILFGTEKDLDHITAPDSAVVALGVGDLQRFLTDEIHHDAIFFQLYAE